MTGQEDGDIIEGEVKTLAVRQTDYVPSFAITLDEAQKRLGEFKQFISEQMVEGEELWLLRILLLILRG